MAKRVRLILERHQQLGDELWKVMPKQYVPDQAKGERWDSEFAEAEGSTLACLWRRAVHEFANAHEWLADLTAYLLVRADEAERNAKVEADDTADDPGDDADQPESPPEFAECRTPDVGDAPNGPSNMAGQDAVQVAAS
jgi:hypothetical protein